MGEGAGVRRGGEGVFFSRAEKNQKGDKAIPGGRRGALPGIGCGGEGWGEGYFAEPISNSSSPPAMMSECMMYILS